MATELINRYFELRAVTGGWLVEWGYTGTVNNPSKFCRLAEIVFERIGARRLSLAVQLMGGEHEYVTIDEHTYFQSGEDFVRHYNEYYVVVGCRLDTESEARQLIEEFEKILVWKRLKKADQNTTLE